MWNDIRVFNLFTIHMYGVMIAVAILSAYLITEYRAKKKKLNHELIFDLTIWCAVGGLLGAKVLYLITQLGNIIKDPKIIISDFKDGFVVYGGIIFGILAGYLFTRRHKLNFWKYFDIVMPSIALAQGFGRIGCLFAGCCYGVETKSAFSLVFPEHSFAPSNVHLFPSQPVSSALDFLNFIILVFISKFTKADGQVAGFYLIFYSIGRFIIEFFRGDLERGSVLGISTSQFISIFLFIIGLAILIIRTMSAKKTKVEETN